MEKKEWIIPVIAKINVEMTWQKDEAWDEEHDYTIYTSTYVAS